MKKEIHITDSLADEFTQYMQKHPQVYQELAEQITMHLPAQQNSTIVDIGCGPGLLIKELLEKMPDCTLIGIEPNKHMLELAQTLLNDLDATRYKLLKKTVQHTSLTRQSIDVVVSRFSAYAWEKPEQGFTEIYRILKPGGIIFFELLNKGFPLYKRIFVKLSMLCKHAHHEVIRFHIQAYSTAFSHKNIIQVLNKVGFYNPTIIGRKRAWKFQVIAYKPQ